MKKSIFARISAMFAAAFTAAILFAFCTVAASAAEVETVACNTASAVAMVDSSSIETPFALPTTMLAAMPNIQPAVAPAMLLAGGNTGGAANGAADTAYQTVIQFFVKWIRRAGAIVAFIGAIMFALAIKEKDAEGKERGLFTMIAGFVAVAVTIAVDMFDLFN